MTIYCSLFHLLNTLLNLLDIHKINLLQGSHNIANNTECVQWALESGGNHGQPTVCIFGWSWRNMGEQYTYNDNILRKQNVFRIIQCQNKCLTVNNVVFTHW